MFHTFSLFVLIMVFRLPESTSYAGNASLRAVIKSRRGNLFAIKSNLFFRLPEIVFALSLY
ncbi:MAG: hypothetical protein IJ780_03500 [Neisseriaceae bacterium]|nr:hypothetical protein [Neisseriaceae bacterium]